MTIHINVCVAVQHRLAIIDDTILKVVLNCVFIDLRQPLLLALSIVSRV